MLNLFHCAWLFATLWTVGHQAPLSMEFSRQEYWSELPCPFPRDLSHQGSPIQQEKLIWGRFRSSLWRIRTRDFKFSSVQFSSFAQSYPTLCNPMDCCMTGLPVYHQLPEFTQTHVHWVSDAIQPSHPLSFPSPPTFNVSQDQGLFK